MTFGSLAATCQCMIPSVAAQSARGGCAYSQSGSANENGSEYRGLRRTGGDSSDLALAPIIIELFQLFEMTVNIGFYDDSTTCNGNALADRRLLFPLVPNVPKPEGAILIGTKLFSNLSQSEHQTAKIAAVCAHEFGHLLQFKYADQELKRIRDADSSVVRVELFADFICGYHAGIRKMRQDDYPAVMQALNQFRAGDQVFGEEHHGTPEERGQSVREGFKLGSIGRIPPERLTKAALEYVQALTPKKVHSERFC